MRALFVPALLTVALLSQKALAEDWRYCLAPSHAEHKIYISPPFPATVSMDDAESQFGRTLSRSGVRFDDVQCPRSDDQTGALAMQQHAISVNRELGNQVIDLRWRPGG
ncbi:MAG TPA: hypothetical protein VMF12_00495 [Xanthobacteraceae bacterium]|nr:hypothetical protein [Xanthobacteraceae bacterium]